MSQSASVFLLVVGSCGASLHPYQRLACILQSLWLTWKHFKAPKERLISFFPHYLLPKLGNTCILLFGLFNYTIVTSVCSYSCGSLSCVSFHGKGEKNGKCVWPLLCVFLGTSPLNSLPILAERTWTGSTFSPPIPV